MENSRNFYILLILNLSPNYRVFSFDSLIGRCPDLVFKLGQTDTQGERTRAEMLRIVKDLLSL